MALFCALKYAKTWECLVMRMKTKRLISLLLVLVMCLSIGCSVFAATPETVGKYSNYLCLGDSVSPGYGQPPP